MVGLPWAARGRGAGQRALHHRAERPVLQVDPAGWPGDCLPAGPGLASLGLGLASAGPAAPQAPAATGAPFAVHHGRMTAGTVGVHYRDHELLEVI